jgi:murein DD-endopeptidase MepM/ murein hydrolase activator NlpD
LRPVFDSETPSPTRLATPSSVAVEPAPQEHAPAPAPAEPKRLSSPLSCGLFNPMPGAFTAGYAADTGLDLAGMGQPVFAIGAARVVYSEAGHTAWTSPADDDRAILLELDEPLDTDHGRVTLVWYAHMKELAFVQAESEDDGRRVEGGEYLGVSGRANGMHHLHLGLLVDGNTSQSWRTYLREDEVREVLCGLRARSRLPR